MENNKVKILVIGDCHLGSRPYNLSEKEEDIYENFDYILNLILKNNYDFVVILGDFLETKKELKSKAISKLLKLIHNNIKLAIISGNHDEDIISLLEEYPYLLGKTHYGFFIKLESLNKNLIGINYNRDHNVIREIISDIKNLVNPKDTILFLHSNFKELMNYLKDTKDYLTFEDISGFYLVMNGHIHNFYQKDNFINVGSIEIFSSLEVVEKVVIELLFENNEVKIRKINLPLRPTFVIDNREKLIEVISKDYDKKPVIYYDGEESLLPSDILLLEKKSLLFRIRTTEAKFAVLKDIKEMDFKSNFKIIKIDDILKDICQKYKIDKELEDWLINYWKNPKEFQNILESIIDKFRIKEEEGESGHKKA